MRPKWNKKPYVPPAISLDTPSVSRAGTPPPDEVNDAALPMQMNRMSSVKIPRFGRGGGGITKSGAASSSSSAAAAATASRITTRSLAQEMSSLNIMKNSSLVQFLPTVSSMSSRASTVKSLGSQQLSVPSLEAVDDDDEMMAVTSTGDAVEPPSTTANASDADQHHRFSHRLMEKRIIDQYDSDKLLEATTDMFDLLSVDQQARRQHDLPAPGRHVVQEETRLNPAQDREQRNCIRKILGGKYPNMPLQFKWLYKLHHCIHRSQYGFTLFGEFNNDKVKHDVSLKFVSKADTSAHWWRYDESRGCEVPLELDIYQKNSHSALPAFQEYIDTEDFGIVVTRTHGTTRHDRRWYQAKFNTVDWAAHYEMKMLP